MNEPPETCPACDAPKGKREWCWSPVRDVLECLLCGFWISGTACEILRKRPTQAMADAELRYCVDQHKRHVWFQYHRLRGDLSEQAFQDALMAPRSSRAGV